MNDLYKDVPSLLHEARLTHVDWQRELGLLKLQFACLRRNKDGSPIDDPVELHLFGVTAIAAYYSPAAVDTPPSRFQVADPLQAKDLSDWRRSPRDVAMYIDSRHEALNMDTACRTDWLLGASSDVEASDHRVYVSSESNTPGFDRAETGLFIACESIKPFSNGLPLDPDDWRMQYEAWWQGWQDRWDAKTDDDDDEPVYEDTFIPAGIDPAPDLSYRPPQKKCVMLDETDAPPELLAPIIDFHEGHHRRQWERMAHAYPSLDASLKERAIQLQEQHETHDFGHWVYLRHVDAWWQDGRRACVITRGIEHRMPDEEDPASNEETVISYGLRKLNDKWIIWTWSQGWPRHGSAPKLDGQAVWREEWDLE